MDSKTNPTRHEILFSRNISKDDAYQMMRFLSDEVLHDAVLLIELDQNQTNQNKHNWTITWMAQAVRALLQRNQVPVVNDADGLPLRFGLATDEQAVEADKEPLIVRLRTEDQWNALEQKEPVGGERAFVPLAVDRPVLGAPCILQQGELGQLHAQPKQHKPPLRLRDTCIDLVRDERHRRDRLQQHHLIRLALRIIDHESLRRIHSGALRRILLGHP